MTVRIAYPPKSPEPAPLEDRIKALVMRMAKCGPLLPRTVFMRDGVIVTRNGRPTIISWEDWEQ